MDIFSQRKLLKKTVICLVILNLCLIGLFVWKEVVVVNSRPEKIQYKAFEKGDRNDLAGVLKEQLGLSDSQADKIKDLREDFYRQEKVLEAVIRSKRDSMNALMFNIQTDSIQLWKLAKAVADNQYQMELLRIEQAQKLKTICTPEQQEKFEGLVKEIRNYFKPKKKEPKR